MQEQHSVTCPRCGHPVHANSQDELVGAIRKHAQENHDMEMSEEKAKEIIADQSE